MSGTRMDTARAIKACLQYLQIDAREAHLMTVSESIDLLISELDEIIGSEPDQMVIPKWYGKS